MAENFNQPEIFDTVLRDRIPVPQDGAVLGGLERIERQLASTSEQERFDALSGALAYGDTGLELVIQALQDRSWWVQAAAYQLLRDRTEPRAIATVRACEFEFDNPILNVRGKEISRPRGKVQIFREDLGDGENLALVRVPSGMFQMGSLETEEKRNNNETPQHWVNINSFFIGQFPITQIQWWLVANLPQVERPLNYAPSEFKGAEQPVECVTWYEAVEFCQRLSHKTGRSYRLASEAEWEYACRAGTTTPFHLGYTLIDSVANFKATEPYGFAPVGLYREQPIAVGSFGVANAFGVGELHGGVLEWCQDKWHDNYQGAPNNGSVWDSGGDDSRRIVRGGSWYSHPKQCRSAYRGYFTPTEIYSNVGFRVVVSG